MQREVVYGNRTLDNASELPKRHGTFLGDVLRLVSGTGLAQVIGVLIAPILTRLFTPDAFGTAALFTSAAALLGVVACLRYEMSIVLPKSDQDAANLLALSVGTAILMAVLTAALTWYGGAHFASLVGAPAIASYLWLLPATVLITGLFNALNYWNTRTKQYTRLSIARIASALTNAGGSLGAGLAGYTSGGALILAGLAGQTLATLTLGRLIWRDNSRFLLNSIRPRQIVRGARAHKNLPLLSSWSALLNAASWQLPTILLGVFFSPLVVGMYALGFRILQMPLSLVSGAVAQVFFQQAAQAKVDGTLRPLVRSTHRQLLHLALFPLLTLSIFADVMFAAVFGAAWADAGLYVQMLSPWAIVWFISSPLSTLVIALRRQDLEFRLSVITLLARIAGITVGGLLGNAQLAVGLFSLAGIGAYGYLCLVVTSLAGIPWRDTLAMYAKELALFLPFGALMLLLWKFGGNLEWTLIVAALVLFGHGLRTIGSLRQMQQMLTINR